MFIAVDVICAVPLLELWYYELWKNVEIDDWFNVILLRGWSEIGIALVIEENTDVQGVVTAVKCQNTDVQGVVTAV